ncbi:MAG: pantoate--beta-alanine ligase [Cycloclasticus sp.]|nr:pantoate--beta-alanine ligase [Cycloclasticus sp.]MBQ0790812.1 pantoate--beta-alanine ligase [Cycloclasticus sp.]
MRIIQTIKELQQTLNQQRQTARSVALVPTMGNLHQGHLQLVSTAQRHADIVVVSLFVNPTQFGANEDLDGYPRTLQDDIDKLEALNTDILFTPSIDEMYPLGGDNTSYVHVPDITNVLCGASRPGHFDGVTTIVNKLFNISRAEFAVFGEKDFQQVAVIRRMVEDLNIPITIITEPTVREADGLALSSRNGYLSKAQRQLAPQLYATLLEVKIAINAGDKNFKQLEANAKDRLTAQGFKPDYVHIFQRNFLRPACDSDIDLIILAAAFVGTTRLIDNLSVNLSIKSL